MAGFFHDRHSGIVTAYKDVRTYLDYIHKAETGPLTGLNNRGYLDKRLSREIDNAHKHAIPLSIAILDADDFGRINKIYDYPTGDAALRVIADVLTKTGNQNHGLGGTLRRRGILRCYAKYLA